MFPYLVLASWIPLTVLAFMALRPARAAIVVWLGGMLFLPENVYFDAPLVPPIGKHETAALCALVGLLVCSRRQLRAARLGHGSDVFLLLLVPVVAATVLTNREPLVFGSLMLPGLGLRDLVAMLIRTLVYTVTPYLVGRLAVASSRDARMLARTLLGFGVVYAALILFEMRFSPNLHRWVYGFHAREDFSQTIRWGGYRPTVFMEHGLAVGLFVLVVALQAATDGRVSRQRFGMPPGWSTLCFVVLLGLCRSTGAILLGLVTLPAALWAKPRGQLRLAALLAVVVLAYPVMRVTGLFPDRAIVELTRAHLSAERAQSVEVRFDNERLLLDHTTEHLWFGWGGFGRNRVYDESGDNAVITDGYWIIVLSSGGFSLLLCTFGLMLYPVLQAGRVLRRVRAPADGLLLSGMALVQACVVFDLLPNGMFNPMAIVFAGALNRMNIELSRPAEAPAWLAPDQAVFPPA
jgi:hypothetical protein